MKLKQQVGARPETKQTINVSKRTRVSLTIPGDQVYKLLRKLIIANLAEQGFPIPSDPTLMQFNFNTEDQDYGVATGILTELGVEYDITEAEPVRQFDFALITK